ncbi:MAG: FAD-linked oxidase C-terminal domain-containing protein, partial [Planctomycetaceae bacterium]
MSATPGNVSAGDSVAGNPGAVRLADRLTADLAAVIEPFSPEIDRHQPRLLRNRCGYNLRGVLRDGWFDWPRLLVGSEGTLALFSGATLHTLPLPAHRGVVLLLFGQLDAALAGVQALQSHDVAACDLLDRRVLALACEGDLRFKPIIPADSEAALLVEHVGVTAAEVSHRLHAAVRAVSEVAGGNVLAHLAETDEEVDFLWSLPETVVPLLARLPGSVRPLPFVEDIAVPPEALREFLGSAQGVLRKHRVIASLYAHAAAGQVHLRPFLPPPTPETAGQLDEIASDLYELVARVGGTISGEHGTGLSRSGFVRQQYGEFHRVFEQIKRVCDPDWLLNPGKVVTEDRLLGTRNLRPPATPATPLVPLQLNWTAEAAVEAAGRCNGCGGCRTREAESRMCPLFRAGLGEEATPRAKANVVRQVLTGELSSDLTRSAEFKELIDLCINCQQCADECPSRVDIPHLVLEA